MNTIEFVNYLRKLNIKLFLEGDRLRCKAPEGILTPDLKSEISARKAEIISFLQQANLQTNTTAIAPISRTENNSFPLSFTQEGLWFLYELQPDSPFYNIPLNLHFSGQLNIAALESSLQLLIDRHKILRTNFITVDGKPAQVINAIKDFSLPVVDLRSVSASERDLEYQKLASLAASYVFNLTEEPLLWAKLVQLTPTENILLLTIHHIIFDGWSVKVFVQELTKIYSTLVEHSKPNLPQINLQYVDFAVWQKQWLQGEVLESQLAYWQQKLALMPELLELPTDRPRPAVQSFRGETQVFTIEPDISEALVNLSQQQGVTLFMLLLTAFKVLLYRYTNQPDIVVGSTVANRQNPQLQGMLGFFVNTLVLRTDLSDNPTFLDLLQQVKKVVLEAYANQELPFDKLVEALRPERNLSYSPLFQIDFSLEHEATSAINLKDLTINISNPETNHTAKFDLSLSLQKTERGLTGGFEYSTDLFDATTIARMIEHWQTLLVGIVANPEQKLSDLPILKASEKHRLLVEWNQTQQDYPKNLCIHQLFEAQVEQTPNAVAVIFKDEQLTYRELNTKANQLAHHLQALGVKPETLVGICVERSFEMIIGLLGILKAGGAYVPIDPAYPSERIAYMLNDSQLPILLTQQKLVASLPKHQAQVICLDSDWEEISKGSELAPQSDVIPENLAYVIYTSGSTGKPKGVTIQHQSLVNYIHAVSIEYEIDKCDRILQFSSISFDVSAEEIYTTFISGATLVLRTDSMLDSIKVFLQKCIDWNLTVLVLPTAYWHEITTFLNQEKFALPESLRLVVIGGEKALTQRWKTWLEYVGQRVRLVNNYGPTEATIGATIYDLSADQPILRELPIGRPICNVQTYILDRYLQPVPVGVLGELHIGGVGLAIGYLNRPDLTQEKFIPNPFSNQPGSRLYKTGDLARYLPDGNIEYLGRIDNQVKIRGFRIELGEIETAISQHPSVTQTVVITVENNIGNKQLVAYIIPQPQAAPTSSDLRNFLKQKLPDYMIPAVFIMLETFPLTPNGKIDTSALPKPETAHQQLTTTKVPPQTATQKILASIWAEVLQVQEIGIHDNFFELGGDSIISIQIIARCHQANLHLTVKDLFQYQTIAELAQIVTTTTEIKAEQGLVTGLVPLTPILHWFTSQNLPEPHHFNQSFLFEISPDVKPEILRQVFQQLLLHHDALRLRLIPNDDTWQLINAPAEETEIFSVIDLSQIAPAEQITAIEATANQLQASLNLLEGPIIHTTLFHLGNNLPNRLLIIIHHLAVDGVSWRILLEDLITAYQQLSQEKTIQLPAKTTSFQEWAIKLTEYAQTQTALAELDYWLNQLDSHIAPLPVDYPTAIGQNQIADTAEVSVSLSVEQTTALLQEVPQAYNTQINDVLLTALAQSFAQWTGQTSLLIDLEGHGREELFENVNLSRTVGWFTSVFPVLLQLERPKFTGKSLKAIKEQLRCIPQRGIGYGILRYLSEDETIRHQLQQLPQAQICFNYLGQFDQMVSEFPILGLAKESSGSPVSLKGNRSHLLDINGFVADGKLQLSWAYNTKLHNKATIEQLANSFIEALTGIISHCLLPEAFGYTPTDFPDAELTQAELDELVESLTPRTLIESIYPLSPMQEGMLFHTLYAPNSGVYFDQFVFNLSGNLNISALKKAWQRVVELHPILRTFFVWENRQHPLQVVCKSVNLPWHIYDWRSLEEAKQKEGLETFLRTERERGVELDKAPLMRCTLIQLADDHYQFVWSNHHALMDGWCLPIILKQVWTFYEAFVRGENLYLEAPPPYRNYIAWLRQQDTEAAQKFWRSQLAGFTAPTHLMVDKSVGDLSKQQDTYDEQGIKLSATLTDALSSFARQHHLTLNTLVQGAWALLLSRYSGESDVVFGETVSGRPPALSGVESMVGLFINTLPVRVQISPETELLSWLKELQVSQVEREEYSYSPLVEIQGVSDIPRNLPLFNSIVVFENYPVDSSLLEEKGSIKISNFVGFEKTNYPLTVGVVPGEELFIQISYDANRFDNDTVSQMLGHLESLLSGMFAHPSRRVCELPLLTPKEKQKILIEWNDTASYYPEDKCIHQLFEEQVKLNPDAVAVVFEEEQLTYRELNLRANQLAHYLRVLGVKPEVLVGICVERSLEMIVGLLGILKAGGAYVPIDPAYPSERKAFMLQDSSVSVLLTQQNLVQKLPPISARVVCLDSNWEEIAFHSKENPSILVKPENLAYVIYTSGSTGKPKGVLIEHRSLVNYTTAVIAGYGLEKSDRILQFASISFDASAEEIYPCLTLGATLVLRTDFMLDSASVFLEKCQTWDLTVLILPTAYWYELTARLSQESIVFPPSLRSVIFGGEKAMLERLKTWQECVGQQVHLVNGYGPTEATVVATIYDLSKSDLKSTTLPIGRPIGNTQIYILDRYLQPVPIGVPGELHISGVGLARGYLNRPDLTQEKFIPNPFSNQPGERLYKTGDLARYLPDGNIEYLGRIDNQVKIRGFRIELGEIETALGQHPAIRETVVIATESITGNQQLVAYLVPQTEVLPGVNELRHFLKQQLPDYMIPSAFVTLDKLPLTPNGKIDHRALPLPEIRPELELTFVAPRTPLEEILANIWSDVLGIKPIGIDNNFFTLGGHSLLATQIISRISSNLGVEIPLRDLFEFPTIGELAEQIQILLLCEQLPQRPPILPIERTTEIPLSFAQARLWFLDQLQPESAFYNIPQILRLQGQLNIKALESSLNEIIRRHEALRTNFTTKNGRPVQIIHANLKLELQVIDLVNLSEEVREIEAKRLVTQLANQPFNLQQEPLLRSSLLKLGEQDYIFVLALHHIVADGWSTGVLEQELNTIYAALCKSQTPALPEVPIQYADFAVWQRNWLRSEVFQTQLNYWQEQLKGIPALLELPTDRPRPAIQSYRGAYQSFQLPIELSEALISLSLRMGVTPFMLILTAFHTLLYRLSGQDDIVVGTPVANRHYRETEQLIGFFVNTLALRANNLSLNPSFEELVSQVREVTLGAYAHQDMPFEELVEALQPERSLSYSPIFQVMFAFENQPKSNFSLLGLNISPLAVEIGSAKFDLALSLHNTNDGLIGEWEYNTDLFDGATIARITRHFQTLLSGIVTNAKIRISEFSLLTKAEKHQLLVEWNNTTKDYPQDKCIHQLFEEQVELNPDAVAVVFEGKQLTYRELNVKANQLAHYLQTLGIKPEVLVGICVERSLEMIVGLLGILKAGGAYVPIDPAYPSERIAYMLDDSGVSVLLTQKQLIPSLPEHQAQVICLDSNWEEISKQSDLSPISGVTSENLAYVIYTSGSTGKPKGVLVTHQGLCNLALAQIKLFDVQPDSCVLQFASISFDASISEIVMALCSGARLCVGTLQSLQPGQPLMQLLQEQGITHLTLVPSALAALPSEELPALQNIIVAGEPCPPSLVTQWAKGRRFFNAYGPTESTVCATVAQCFEGMDVLPIGRPIDNTQVYILDRYLQPVPIGVPGELHIASVGLARGYLNRPDLTADKFIPNPFSNKPDSRLYKTGDLARYLPDGNIEFLGRIDNQVKIRGFRIELGEIEAALAQYPDVIEGVVICREDNPGDKKMVAYITCNLIPDRIPYHSECQLEVDSNAIKCHIEDISTGGVAVVGVPAINPDKSCRLHLQLPGQEASQWLSGTVAWSHPPKAGIGFHLTPLEQTQVEQSVAYLLKSQDWGKTLQRTMTRNLRDYLKQKLPGYMIPSAFVLMKALPLTPNGKIDHRALPKPDSFNLWNENCFVAPHDTLELQLSQIWSEILDVYPVGVQDNFFTLGGHSLLAVRLMARIEEQFGINLPLATLFSSPTIEQLAVHLRTSEDSGYWSPLIPIQSNGQKQPFFCVPGIGGNILYFYELARHLGSDQPFYGLQARGLDGKSEPFTNVEDMAAYYIEAIQIVQSQGPYLIGGHSFGGLVAFEIAQQLQKQGHEVALVAIIDTVAPILSKNSMEVNEDELDFIEFASYMEYMFYPKWELDKETLASLTPNEQLNYLQSKWNEFNSLPKDLASQSFRGLVEVYKANHKAHFNYCPAQVIPTQILVFRASEIEPTDVVIEELTELLKDPTLGWSKFSTNNEAYVIPGNHMTIMQKPHVQILATQMKTSLEIAKTIKIRDFDGTKKQKPA